MFCRKLLNRAPFFSRFLFLVLGQLAGFWGGLDRWWEAGLLSLAVVNLFTLRVFWIYLLGVITTFLSFPAQQLSFSKHPQRLIGIVQGEPRHRTAGLIEFDLKTSRGIIRCRGKDLPWLRVHTVSDGAEVAVLANVAPLKPTLNPFAFDSLQMISGISGRGKVIAAAPISSPSIFSRLPVLNTLQTTMVQHIPSAKTRGVMSAMSWGDEHEVSNATEDLFRKTGLLHLLVVSGYQVMLWYFISSELLFLLMPTRLRESGVGGIVSIVLGFFTCCLFAWLAGLAFATQRAVLMAGVMSFLRVFSVRMTLASCTFFTSILFLLIHPGSGFTPSFHLTLAALLGFSVAAELKLKNLWSSLLPIVVATLFTSLVSWGWFGGFSPLSIPMNIIMAPLFTLISTVGTVAGITFSATIDQSGSILRIVAWLTDLLLLVMEQCSTMVGDSNSTSAFVGASLAFIVFAITVKSVKVHLRRRLVAGWFRRRVGLRISA